MGEVGVVRFDISQTSLARAMATVGKGVSSSATTSVYGGVRIEARDGEVEFRTTDGRVSVSHVAPANVEGQGATVLSWHVLERVVKGMPDRAVSFELDGQKMSVRCGKSRWSLNALADGGFPDFPEFDVRASVTLPRATLADMAGRTCAAASRDRSESNQALLGILLTVGDGRLSLSATDRNRATVCETSVPCKDETSVIIPADALRSALSIPSDAPDVAIRVGDRHVSLRMGGSTLVTPRIVWTYPNLALLFPKVSTTRIRVDAGALCDALKRVSAVAGLERRVTLVTEESLAPSVTLRSRSVDAGNSVETLDVQSVEGERLEIHLNHAYLNDAAATVDGEAWLLAEGSMKPLVVKSDGDVSQTWLIMPMRPEA